jgi:hypothetical protein
MESVELQAGTFTYLETGSGLPGPPPNPALDHTAGRRWMG